MLCDRSTQPVTALLYSSPGRLLRIRLDHLTRYIALYSVDPDSTPLLYSRISIHAFKHRILVANHQRVEARDLLLTIAP